MSYHPALAGIFGALSRLQSTLDAFEEHQKLFPSKPLVAFSGLSVESLTVTLVTALFQHSKRILSRAVINVANPIAKYVSLCHKGIIFSRYWQGI